jgi:hypothetical protein
MDVFGQNIPVGTPLLEESYRRLQTNAKIKTDISFLIRPVSLPRNPDSITAYHNTPEPLTINKVSTIRSKNLQILPLEWKQQYNSGFGYGMNDGAMIPARGYSTQLSTGIAARYKFISIQIQPELVFAQNRAHSTQPLFNDDSVTRSYYNTVLNRIDAPEKFGDGVYTRLLPGQSHIQIEYKNMAIGISSENLWWGPGIRNSLTMSNNAPGFLHASFHTTAPVKTVVGSFEWQLLSGKLKSSGIIADSTIFFQGERLLRKKNNGDRYLNALAATWQPRWLKGLFLGFANVFYLYEEDISGGAGGYLPVFGWFFSDGRNAEQERTDQMLSLFFRWVLSKEKMELYGEFGKNDHSGSVLDFILEPEHSMAFILGIKKSFELNKNKQVEVMSELTQLQIPSTIMLREQGSWYSHFQVLHGYTNRGQVIGAGIGPGGNSQTFGVQVIEGIKKTGIQLERVLHNNDFYYDAFTPTRNTQRHWVDISLQLHRNWLYKNLLISTQLNFTRAFNYQWQQGKHVNNLQLALTLNLWTSPKN